MDEIAMREKDLMDIMRFDDPKWYRAFRKAHNYTQQNLSCDIQVTTFLLSQFENGDRMRAETIRTITKEYKLWVKTQFYSTNFEDRDLLTIKTILYYIEHEPTKYYMRDDNYKKEVYRLWLKATKHICMETNLFDRKELYA